MSVRDLLKLCDEQHFPYRKTKNNHWFIKSPDGQKSVSMSDSANPRDLLNNITELRKIGLRLPDDHHKHEEVILPKDPSEPVRRVAPLTLDSVAAALDTAIELIEELAGAFKYHKEQVAEEIATLRETKVQELPASVALKADVDVVNRALSTVCAAWEAKFSELEKSVAAADPVADFRRRIRG